MELEKLCDINLYQGDCMDLMRQYPDKYFELAIVDPPYGLPKDSVHGRGKLKNRAINTMNMKWDVAPNNDYFIELFRISNNQIIWGGNYFPLPPSRCILCWDKCQPWENFSQIELAWTSFDYPAQIFKFDNRTGGKIHPTQKPVQLYKWLLQKYAKEGDKILDTHFGSLSIGIACHDLHFELTASELDKEYYELGKNRLMWHQKQLNLF